MSTPLAPPPGTTPALPLIDSKHRHRGWRGLRGYLFTKVATQILRPVEPSVQHGLPVPMTFAPDGGARRFGLVHYGIMIPDLPAPHQFMATAIILGSAGMRVFDTDFAAAPGDGPLQTATLVHGTAAAVDRHFTHYSIPRDTEWHADGSLLRLGGDLELSGRYPEFRLKSRRDGFAVDLALTATGDVTWFAKGRFYEHIALVTRYRGTIEHGGTAIDVSGLCTYEYARGTSPYLLYNRFLPKAAKLPWNVFSYQVIDLDADTQLLLAHIQVDGHSALTSAYLRVVGQCAHRLDADVHFRVLSAQARPAVAPDGNEMRLPETFTWRVRDRHGRNLFAIDATVDTPMLFGIGTGYVGGYRWEGERDGRPAGGRGYIEYVDRRS
ncbi:hypothetical protein WT60_11850 [Burkholderia sp. MSMB617WGS]|uniref:DUF6670 family protein n=1 Tax=Burkholderia sp. MSMB617WGS TaxID=1637831 RepID=UPI00075F6FCF|nr:DUF6670 family protein [Burkholderia sp. MSMB617WGS]AOK47461.1 hypothetical protein WT60_11850 [Burkholderia sp. MSMB617WGS]